MATTSEPTNAEIRAWRIEELLASNAIGNTWTPETAAARVDGNARLARLRRIDRAIEDAYSAAMRDVDAAFAPGSGRDRRVEEERIEGRYGIPALAALLGNIRAAIGAEMARTYPDD